MKLRITLVALLLFGLSCILVFIGNQKAGKHIFSDDLERVGFPDVKSSFSAKSGDDAVSRAQFHHSRLRDPATDRIPRNMRQRELEFARKLPKRDQLSKIAGTQNAATWIARGPRNVGGRTRALAVDLDFNGTTNRRILAGGISGGMYLSDDDGATWNMTTGLSQLPSVTTVAQDPNNRNIWYYGTGEEIGNSVQGLNYLGQGVFKSTDGGENWNQLSSTVQGTSLTEFDNLFDQVWTLAIDGQTGALFAATIGAIHRSDDGGDSWSLVLLGQDDQNFLSRATDVATASDGTVYATLGRNGTNLSTLEFGIFRSDDGGNQFSNINPPGLSGDPYRMVVGVAPSAAATVYLLVQANANGTSAQDHQLFRYNATTGNWSDLSANIPNEAGVTGTFDSQGGYDLMVKVKPDDPDVVWIGGTNLYRSTNGGQTFTRVGGYASPDFFALYENHHPDQHSMSFYPNNTNRMISGHDGGLSRAENALQQPQTWTPINNGYVTTQFYAVAINPQPGDDEFILGGMQDNGTWRTFSTDPASPWIETYVGDGGYAAIAYGGLPFYVSSQLGDILRVTVSNNQLIGTVVAPQSAQNFLFIAPYILDPNDNRVMYLAAGNVVWRNSNVEAIPDGNQTPTPINWTALSNSAVSNTTVTTLAVSRTPAARLYFGATGQGSTVLRRVDNPQNNPGGSDITPPGVTGGSNTSSIGINPDDANEILVTYSNYGVPSLWHSTDGGLTWSEVEGNLAGADGPSARWAVITTSGEYYVATSVGVYSAAQLDGSNTTWVLEGSDVIGNVVVDMLAYRSEDGFIVAGTHGRGVYSANLSSGGSAITSTDVQSVTIESEPGGMGSTSFNLENTGSANLSYSITATGDFSGSANQNQHGFAGVLQDSKPLTFYPKQAEPAGKPVSPVASGLQEKDHLPDMPAGEQQDVLVLDDGDDFADDFIGFGDGVTDFFWENFITLSGFDFKLDGFFFYMRTESAFSNTVYAAVFDETGSTLVEGNIDLGLASDGAWYTITLNSPITFKDGEAFQVLVGASGAINFPAGADVDAIVPNNSFFFDPFQNQYVNLATISGFENGAFMIRPFGSIITEQNQAPNAVADISNSQPTVNEEITFDASNSTDPDGQIVSTFWNFGDGATSTNEVATHAYSQAGDFTYTLTVTDNSGGTDQASGQISVQEGINRLTVQPASGTITPGASQNILVMLDAQDLAARVYHGEVRITGNGGTITLPLTMIVDDPTSVEETEQVPTKFVLEQNYPNPFNPTTTIQFTLAKGANVKLKVFSLEGKEVATLVNDALTPGVHTFRFEANGLPSGIYFYRIETGEVYQTRRLMLLK